MIGTINVVENKTDALLLNDADPPALPSVEAIKDVLAQLALEAWCARARESLIEFACFIDAAAARWYRAAHLAQIAQVLERVERGELTRVCISTPPRHWKSSLASEKFPAWWLGRNPRGAVIVASYALSLAEKFSRTVRDTIESNLHYRAVFPDVVLRRDSTRMDDWTLATGTRSSLRAVGVGGGITGHGANLIIIDDPISDYEAAQSETQRNNLWEWYRQVLRTRAESGAAIVLIQTRWHEDDLAGKLIAEQKRGGEEWTVINLPALSGGVPLWRERFSIEDLTATRAAIGEYAWRALYLGNPSADAGEEIKREWMRDKFFPDLPAGERWRVRWWDLAITEKQVDKPNPDYTASVKATLRNGDLWLGAPVLIRAKWHDVRAEIERVYMNERDVALGMSKSAIETMTVQELVRAGIPFSQCTEKGDKRTRAQSWIRLAEQGRVKLVGTPEQWEQFLAQWWQFPSGAHDDAVDAVSGIAMMLGLLFEPQIVPKQPQYDRRGEQFFRALESDM